MALTLEFLATIFSLKIGRRVLIGDTVLPEALSAISARHNRLD